MLIALDLETTGLDCTKHSILEIGMIVFRNDVEFKVSDSPSHPIFQQLVRDTKKEVDPDAIRVNGLNPDLVWNDPRSKSPADLIDTIRQWLSALDLGKEKPRLLGHNVFFDIRFLENLYRDCGQNLWDMFDYHPVDTASVVQFLKDAERLPSDFPMSLHAIMRNKLQIPILPVHEALSDCAYTIRLYNYLMERVEKHGYHIVS